MKTLENGTPVRYRGEEQSGRVVDSKAKLKTRRSNQGGFQAGHGHSVATVTLYRVHWDGETEPDGAWYFREELVTL